MAEMVYGTTEEGHVMSEKVSSLASTIYKEFERMMRNYDEDVVTGLMPLIVGILEALDNAYSEKQETDVECELLRDDNEQLLTQYEREKQLRKAAEQKYLELEDAVEGEKKDLQDKVETLESILRMLELKSKNAADHVSRLEEKETEMKKEYNKLHERYTELFKTHMDYMERTKILLGTDKLSEMTGNSPRVKGAFQLPTLRPVSMFVQGSTDSPVRVDNSCMSFDLTSPRSGRDSDISIRSELSDFDSPVKATHDKEQSTDNVSTANRSTTTMDATIKSIVASTPELDDSYNSQGESRGSSRLNNATIFDEIATQGGDIADVDFGADITGREVNPGDYASSVSDNFFGMGKELENLILENTELLATKNALNIVKDDLIAKVDELSSEQEILREEITSMQAIKGRLQLRITQLEEEVKKMREEMQKKSTVPGEDEDDVPMAQRKRFTRVEMARVLMERNQYKERLMELQEAVRWTEMIRATREHPEAGLQPKKKSSIWNFFSSVITSGEPATPPSPDKKRINVQAKDESPRLVQPRPVVFPPRLTTPRPRLITPRPHLASKLPVASPNLQALTHHVNDTLPHSPVTSPPPIFNYHGDDALPHTPLTSPPPELNTSESTLSNSEGSCVPPHLITPLPHLVIIPPLPIGKIRSGSTTDATDSGIDLASGIKEL